tara:strand:+ start:898 stop:1350 length:453 start_codon:yes stop_codon:yes gene_type:complete
MSFISILQGGKAAKKLGDYNNSLYNRDADIQRQEKDNAWKFYETFEKPKFKKTSEEIKDSLEVSYLKSGVIMEGTPILTFVDQDYELDTDAEILKHNAMTAKSRSENAALMSEAKGMLASWEGKLKKRQSYYDAGQSLLNNAATIYGMTK